jgi:hypothetical protein
MDRLQLATAGPASRCRRWLTIWWRKRIDAGDRRLTAVQWKSGSNMPVIDVVAPFGGEAEMQGQIAKGQQKPC